MWARRLLGVIALAAAQTLATASAGSQDLGRFPDWKGQWQNLGRKIWDPTKPVMAQEAPLTLEYQARFKASLADQAAGGHGNDLMYKCIPPGMPRMMVAYYPFEFIMTPDVTYIAFEHMTQLRRVYTDGRDWPDDLERSLVGYSIGRWIDEDGDGRYDGLAIETRGFRGPRAFETTGIPLHDDNQTVVKEYFSLDRKNPNVLRDEITTIDHALTHPWTVIKPFTRVKDTMWGENVCNEANHHVELSTGNYFLSVDGFLMPTHKDQPPPDLRNFNQPPK
jgi:hypothetical protein